MHAVKNNGGKQHILVLKKAFYIQEQMMKYPYGISLAELTSLVNMNKSSIFRILDTLRSLGYILQSPENGNYYLSRKYLLLAAAADVDLKTIARKHLVTLAQKTNELCHLVVREGNIVVCIDKVEVNPHGNPIQIISYIGKPSFMHCTSVGKLFLANLPEEEVKSIVAQTGLPKRTKNTITNYAALKEELARILQRGYSIDNVEDQENVRCIATPIYNSQGQLIAAIGLSGTILTVTEEVMPSLIAKLNSCAQNISKDLGYFPAQSNTKL